MKDMMYRALIVREGDGKFTRKIEERNINELPPNNVLIKVQYSSLNYKDALSATGNKGVTRRYPFQPGIDASGIVEQSESPLINKGDEVLVTGYDLGMNTDGGFGEYIRVPGEWVVPKPSALTLRDCMVYGTAGFTAALGIDKMLRMGQKPEDGRILVTGASGGVGSLVVSILSRLGFEVVAATGKAVANDYLKEIGASEIIERNEVDDESGKFLLKPQWSGAFDTVGGNTLNTVLKACKVHGSVATAGNARSFKLDTTVFPFILNGVNLLGVNSATCSMDHRKELWDKLAGKWRISNLDKIGHSMKLEELDHYINEILKGKIMGRMVLEY